jgi:FAD/FMN-containing dehydrogenase
MTSDNLKSCLKSALKEGDSVAFSGDIFYQLVDAKRYNLNIHVTPAAITFPSSSQEVAAVVKCAADNGYPVQAKSGGHSYGNYGLFSAGSVRSNHCIQWI